MLARHVVLLTFSNDGHRPLWSYPYTGTLPQLISLFAILTKTVGCCTQNSQSGTLCSAFTNLIPHRYSSPRKSFRCNTYRSLASVANKRLTVILNPLDALTKNRGVAGCYC